MERSNFIYTPELIGSAMTYYAYRQHVKENIAKPAADEAAERLRAFSERNSRLMDEYDQSYRVSDELKYIIRQAPETVWLVLTEGWCGDAAFNLPMMAAAEKMIPEKIRLLILLRDSNTELMDAHLTDGGRSIPKLIVLDKNLEELATWGPRPEEIQKQMKKWKSEGMEMKQLIIKAKEWYDADATQSLQAELCRLVRSYS